MKMRIFLMLILAAVLTGTGRAEVVLDVTFGHLGYDADGLTSDGQLCVDSSGNSYHGFLGGGSGAAVVPGATGSKAIDTSDNNVYVILRDDRTYTSHGELDIADPITTPTPYFTLEADKSYTFEAILKWDPASTNGVHGIMGQTGGNEFWFRENGGALQWAMVSDGFNANNFGTNVDISALEADGQWHHIALVLDRTAAEIRVYADYELIYTHTAGVASLGAMLNGEGDFRLGAYNTSSSARFDGQQDHYRISDMVVKPHEFLQMDSSSAPTPADGDKGVVSDAELSWTSAADPNAPTETITGQFIYLGTDPAALVLQNPTAQTGTTFDPGALAKDTRYYWRVDGQVNNGPANDPNLTVPGLVWTFETELSLPVIDVNPKDDRVFVDTGESAEFTVVATNPLGGDPDYQWYEGVSPDTSSPVTGETTATLIIANVTAGDVGRQFYCSVSNVNGSVDTTSAGIFAKTQVAHWKLDYIGQTEPNAIDSSGNGYDGTNAGATLVTEGKIDEAFAFNGSSHVDLTDHSAAFSGLQ